MFWFKNAIIYRLTKKLNWSQDQLQEALKSCEFFPCGKYDMSKFGWVNPLKGSDLLHFSSGKQILLVAQKEEKILPSQVINSELQQRINELEEKEHRKLRKTEKQALKDDVVSVLLRRAFSKNLHTAMWIDTENQLVYVDTSSYKRAEDCLGLLRKSLGSLPVIPLLFANAASVIMSNWITNDNVPQWLITNAEAEIKGIDDKSVIRCKRQDLDAEEVLSLLNKEKYVTQLALEWEEHLSFVLKEDYTLKRLKFADEVLEKNDDILKEDFAQRFDADFVLMTSTLSKLTEKLLTEFGGERQRG